MQQLVNIVKIGTNRVLRLCPSHTHGLSLPAKVIGTCPDKCEQCKPPVRVFIVTVLLDKNKRCKTLCENHVQTFLDDDGSTLVGLHDIRKASYACAVCGVPATED